MTMKLSDLVRFQSERLFQGAVNLDWFLTDPSRRESAARAFVFHGPQYHGVKQEDIGTGHGHRLQDTASFARDVVRSCCGAHEQPFTLAIAGYGTGKSHLAITLASLLSDWQNDLGKAIVGNLHAADSGIGSDIKVLLDEQANPCLVLALNGMRSFDLTAEVMRQTIEQVRAKNLDTRPLDDLRPRFKQAVSLIGMSNPDVQQELVEQCSVSRLEELIEELEKQEESTYSKVHKFFSARGMPIRALGGESVREVIETVVRVYCGEDKPFSRMLILFDEFGRYTEFATIRSQVAGSGVLQDLFEAVQSHSDRVSFVGFIQFELSVYVQRVAPEYKNDILRYVTRYQSANRVYLSINLETLVANLLEKKWTKEQANWFQGDEAKSSSAETREKLTQWFPQAVNHRLWQDPEQFHNVITQGCWPLSPYATWFLFHLAAAGKHLQERSALSLLSDAIERTRDRKTASATHPLLSPVDFWSGDLQQELISSEEVGQQGAITHSYASVYERHGEQLGRELGSLLQAIVLASKMGLHAESRTDAIRALAVLSGVQKSAAQNGISRLQDEFNVIEWDERFNQFDILGDAVPRTQFLAFLRQHVASAYDEEGKAKLFASKAMSNCDLLRDLDCDFSEVNSVSTREWYYQAVASDLTSLVTQLKFAANRWQNALGIDEPRGTIVYCYVEQSRDAEVVTSDAKKLLRGVIRESGEQHLPIFVVLLCDEKGALGQALAELEILNHALTAEDRAKFGNLVGAHKAKMLQMVDNLVEAMIKQRRYVTSLSDNVESTRLGRVGTELFAKIYKKPLAFPFDGFSTARGNAADTCQALTIELLAGSLDFDAVTAKPAKAKNRAVTVLSEAWGIFTKGGRVTRRPSNPVVRSLTEKWDDAIRPGQEPFNVAQAMKDVCRPPYGANIASAGLLLGVFVAPRTDGLILVRNGQQYAISQWLQDGIFKGKFLDLSVLSEAELTVIGDESSEWQALLDEWEQAGAYQAQRECLRRALELKERVPIPPASNYRYLHLEQQARAAASTLDETAAKIDEALSFLEQGYIRNDVSRMSRGAANLLDMQQRMLADGPVWTTHEINEIQPHVERGRQAIIQAFPEWLLHQAPRSGTPEVIGDFKHKMIRLCGGNLQKLGLDSQFTELEHRVTLLIRNAETSAEAKQLVRDVRSWTEQHADACRVVRVAELRGLRGIGKGFSAKLQGMSRRIDLADISEAREALAKFMTDLKQAEDSAMKRASAIWDRNLKSRDDVTGTLEEVESLIRVFEGCENDLEDMRVMKRQLQVFTRDYDELCDQRSTWKQFEENSQKLRGAAAKAFEEEETPWDTEQTYDAFVVSIKAAREEASHSWLRTLDEQSTSVEQMSAADANRIHTLASNPPPVLIPADFERLAVIKGKIVERLDSLALDWLVEKFKELPESARRKFIEIAKELAGNV